MRAALLRSALSCSHGYLPLLQAMEESAVTLGEEKMLAHFEVRHAAH